MFNLPHVKLGLAYQVDGGNHADTEYFNNEVLPKLTGEIRKQVLSDMSVMYHVGLKDAMTISRMMEKYNKEHSRD